MELLEWLAALLREFFPPWVILGPDAEGVRIRSLPVPWFVKQWTEGRKVLGAPWAPPNWQFIRPLKPGFVFSIPFIDEVREANVKYGKVDLDSMGVETADGEVYYISLVLRYRVFNAHRALIEVDDYESSLYAAVTSVVVAWANTVHGQIRVNDLIRECEPKIKALGADWGCRCVGIEVNNLNRPWTTQEIELKHRLLPDA